jgi:ectoine hydroxylase-related dioxygenase (phytanoyl-CoA dioxygenase family)
MQPRAQSTSMTPTVEHVAAPANTQPAPARAPVPALRYRLSVDEYVRFHEQGFLVVKGLVSQDEVDELRAHTEDIIHQRIDLPGIPAAPYASGGATHSGIIDPTALGEIERRYVRIHMLHRVLECHERYLLHPRILDVLEALIGPDVMAMQTMLFLKPPGSDGQGFHQDSYYIPTLPDSLCGAWLAIDRADEENGCMHFAVGSQCEPVYPDEGNRRGHYPLGELEGLRIISGASDTNEAHNGLTPIVDKYRAREVVVPADPGDVVFFGGHIIHWSHANRTRDRFRRSFVGHYANARAFTQWGGGNAQHILARGTTHLPYAQPRFGTPCAANQPQPARDAAPAATMMASGGMMMSTPTDPERLDPSKHDH